MLELRAPTWPTIVQLTVAESSDSVAVNMKPASSVDGSNRRESVVKRGVQQIRCLRSTWRLVDPWMCGEQRYDEPGQQLRRTGRPVAATPAHHRSTQWRGPR